MEQVNVTPSLAEGVSILDAARENLVRAAKGTKDVIQGYADALCAAFGAEWWLLVGKEKRGVKAERDKFVAAMVERGLGKPTADVYWQRVKEASGYVTAGNRVKGENDCDTKTIADLRTIINRILAAESDGKDPKASEFKRDLMDIYQGMTGKEFLDK